ncbi:MAG: hypothetical protein NT172_13990 [Planctomycetota bacterium]|nr:hypothetical protein [Planctomycetota bacterium]
MSRVPNEQSPAKKVPEALNPTHRHGSMAFAVGPFEHGVGLGPAPHGCVEGLVVGGLVEAAGAFFNPLVAWAEHLAIAGFTKIQHALCSREGFAVFVAVLLIGR